MFFTLQPPIIQIEVSQIANLQYFEFTDEFRSVQDRHDFCELLYVDKGSLNIFAENYSGPLLENQVLIHRPNELHALATSDSVAPNVIIIGFTCSSPKLEPFSHRPVTLSAEQTKALAKIMQEGMSIYEPPYDVPNTLYMPKRAKYPFGADQLIKIGLEAFLISLVRTEESTEDASGVSSVNTLAIQAVHQYLSQNYRTRITLDNLCFLFGINKTSLCYGFKELYGTTVLEYLNALRIQAAKSQLRESSRSVTEIADHLGFSSPHYFCRLFKVMNHCTPTEYRKQSRRD